MKHLHMLMALITLGLFLYQMIFVFSGKQLVLSRVFKGASHLIYLLLVGTGLYLFWQLTQVAGVQHWVIAKLVLLFVAVSANIKAIRPTNTNVQARAGMLLAAMAYLIIVILAYTKPGM